MRQFTKQPVRRFSMLILAMALVLMTTATNASADALFESGTLGTTGIPWSDLTSQIVPGTNINEAVFPGVRFHLNQPAVTSEVGGHFVAPSAGTFFGAIVRLQDENDFPDSKNLSTPDVLGATLLTFPVPSAEVFGDLSLSLDPGWYALVFGSGLFGATGRGGAVRNGLDIDDPAYIGLEPNLGWFNLNIFQTFSGDHRFVLKGTIVPEPSTLITTLVLFVILSSFRHRSLPSNSSMFHFGLRGHHAETIIFLE